MCSLLCVLHPSNQTGGRRQRDDLVWQQMQVSVKSFTFVVEQGVDKREQLHDPLVPSEVLIACQLAGSRVRQVRCAPLSRNVKSELYDMMTSFLGHCLVDKTSIVGRNEAMKDWSSSLMLWSYCPVHQLGHHPDHRYHTHPVR